MLCSAIAFTLQGSSLDMAPEPRVHSVSKQGTLACNMCPQSLPL